MTSSGTWSWCSVGCPRSWCLWLINSWRGPGTSGDAIVNRTTIVCDTIRYTVCHTIVLAISGSCTIKRTISNDDKLNVAACFRFVPAGVRNFANSLVAWCVAEQRNSYLGFINVYDNVMSCVDLVWNLSSLTWWSADWCRWSGWMVPVPWSQGDQVQVVDWGQLHSEVVYQDDPNWTCCRTDCLTSSGKDHSPGLCRHWRPSPQSPPPHQSGRRSRSWLSRGRCWHTAWSGTTLRTRHIATVTRRVPAHSLQC